MSPARQIAVLGAGYVGGAVARALTDRGDQVWAVRRRPHADESGITWLEGDLAGGPVRGLPPRLDAVILTVAPSGEDDSYADTYPPAARRALQLTREHGAGTLTYTSSTGVYGGMDGAWVDEASPRDGQGSTLALIAAEDLLLGSAVPGVTVLRVAGIYGPGRDPRARFTKASALPMRGEYWVNLAHREDIVAAILQTLDRTGEPHALNVADGTPTQAADVARWLATERGEDPAALDFANAESRSRSNQRIAVGALMATGWHPRYPSFREGFREGLSPAAAVARVTRVRP